MSMVHAGRAGIGGNADAQGAVDIELFSTAPQSKDVARDRYVRRVVDVARWSEEAGCTGILVYTDNGLVDPWLVSQTIVEHTDRIGPLVAVQPVYMHPYSVAKMVASIAHMHGRRIHLNMLAGGFRNDLIALGDDTPHDERYARTTEYTQIVTKLLAGSEPVTLDGAYYRVENLSLAPSVDPELLPGILISGSSDAGLTAARTLGATAIKYPEPPGEEPGVLEEPVRCGVRIGIVARDRSDDAWAVALERFPEDRKGQIQHQLAMKTSDSHWHEQLSRRADGADGAHGADGTEADAAEAERGDAGDAVRNPYWLGPFRNYKTFCPYLVGSYERVADEVAAYIAGGYRTFVLDIPPSREELEHTQEVFARAREKAGRLIASPVEWNRDGGTRRGTRLGSHGASTAPDATAPAEARSVQTAPDATAPAEARSVQTAPDATAPRTARERRAHDARAAAGAAHEHRTLRTLHDRVSARAQATPDACAVAMGSDRVTYGALESVSNRLAHLLIESGCRPGDRVCILLPKSPQAIASMLAASKAGAMYVPIDVDAPAARVAKALRAAEAFAVVVDASSVALARDALEAEPHHRPPIVGTLDDGELATNGFASFSASDVAALSDARPDVRVRGCDIAHLLFTSGSTGEPKGVPVTHDNVLAFLDWAIPHFGIARDDRISGHPPLHFDLSTFDIYGALTTGAELHLAPKTLNLLPHKLAAFIRDASLTQWFAVPSTYTMMASVDALEPEDFPALRRALFCGEPMPASTLRYWMERLPHVRFTNLYGPTEATIASSHHDVHDVPDDPTASIPIGRPCDGEELLLLDEHGREVPPGDVGEIHIAGAGLSPGYWRDPEKTREVFVPDPRDPTGEARVYRTGDLGRVDEAGRFICLGRTDSQIKLRGYRIELGEIEAVGSSLDAVAEIAVVAVADDGLAGTRICCAYAPANGRPPAVADLRCELERLLPRYMIPSRWKCYDALPKNANGKIDRRAIRGSFEGTA